MTRRYQHERPIWFEERGSICQRATDKFVAELAGKPGVSRILLIGSVARGEPRPTDLDPAVIVANAEEAVPHVSLARRPLPPINHVTDVFVFSAAEKYVGRSSQRSPSNCPTGTSSVECVPGCGAIKCLNRIPDLKARKDILVGARQLWPCKVGSTPKAAVSRLNVYLMGQPGLCRTLLGRIVAERLGRPLFDMDNEVEHFHSKSLGELSSELLGQHSCTHPRSTRCCPSRRSRGAQ